MYNIEYLPQTIRVWLNHEERPALYALIVPNPKNGEFFRDFFLVDDTTGNTVYLFGAEVQSDALAVELAEFAAPQEIQELERMEC